MCVRGKSAKDNSFLPFVTKFFFYTYTKYSENRWQQKTANYFTRHSPFLFYAIYFTACCFFDLTWVSLLLGCMHECVDDNKKSNIGSGLRQGKVFTLKNYITYILRSCVTINRSNTSRLYEAVTRFLLSFLHTFYAISNKM